LDDQSNPQQPNAVDDNPFTTPIAEATLDWTINQASSWIRTPIAFCGSLGEEDRDAKHNRPVVDQTATELFGQFGGIAVKALVTGLLVLLLAVMLEANRANPLIYLLAAFAIHTIWRPVCKGAYLRYKNRSRLNQQQPINHDLVGGFLDDWGICWMRNSYVAHVAWSAVSSVEIPAQDEPIWLPARFFASEEDYQGARQLAHANCPSAEDPPLASSLPDGLWYSNRESWQEEDLNVARAWDVDRWPFDRQSAEPIDVNLVDRSFHIGKSLRSLAVTLGEWLVLSLLCILFTVIWLVAEWRSAGDWSFLGNFSSTLLIVLAAAWLIWNAVAVIGSRFGYRKWQVQPQLYRLDRAGFYFQQGGYQSWTKWTPTTAAAIRQRLTGKSPTTASAIESLMEEI
jgi:hypothetical protein